MMQRVFRGKLSTSDDIALKYKDEGKTLFQQLKLAKKILAIYIMFRW
jgi:hypothetical protein